VLAAIAFGYAMWFTWAAVAEYGPTEVFLKIPMQAALLWVPVTAIFALITVLLIRRIRGGSGS
jgi:ABC-type Co2+ transport system permease subunit